MKTPLGICLLAGVSSIALTAVVVILSTPVVQADALLSRPTLVAPPRPPVVLSATPESLAPRVSAGSKRGDKLRGVASWYGGVFNGRLTASGEVFDMYAMTACHPTLPFGSIVRVVDRQNKRSVVVRITDRGHLFNGRMLDLSYGAAMKLAMIKAGTAEVDLQVLSLGGHHHHIR